MPRRCLSMRHTYMHHAWIKCQARSHCLSTRNRNVPILSEIEMSPFERAILPVGARGKPVLGVFQAAVGAFLASTAASASTGASRLGGAAQRALTVDGAGVATPRVVRARPSGPMGGTRQL